MPGMFLLSPAWSQPVVTLGYWDESEAWRLSGEDKRGSSGRTDDLDGEGEEPRP